MAYLHHHSPVRVIHCDLKPSNVLLNDDLTALISDFGIAKLVMSVGGGNAGVTENTRNSTANMLSGTIGYIAPATRVWVWIKYVYTRRCIQLWNPSPRNGYKKETNRCNVCWRTKPEKMGQELLSSEVGEYNILLIGESSATLL